MQHSKRKKLLIAFCLALFPVVLYLVLESFAATLPLTDYAYRLRAAAITMYAALWALLFIGWRLTSRQNIAQTACSLFLICLLLVYSYPLNSRIRFVKTLHSLKPGTSHQSIQNAMRHYTEQQANSDRLVFTHSQDPSYNSDLGVVFLKAGQVTGTMFFTD